MHPEDASSGVALAGRPVGDAIDWPALAATAATVLSAEPGPDGTVLHLNAGSSTYALPTPAARIPTSARGLERRRLFAAGSLAMHDPVAAKRA